MKKYFSTIAIVVVAFFATLTAVLVNNNLRAEVRELAQQREWKNPVNLGLATETQEWWGFIKGENESGSEHYHFSQPLSVSRFYESLWVPFDVYVEDSDTRIVIVSHKRNPRTFGIELDREFFEYELADVRLELGRQAVADLMAQLRESRCEAPCQDVISPSGKRDYVALGSEINSILSTRVDDYYLFSDAERDVWRAETRELVAGRAAEELAVLYRDEEHFYSRDKFVRVEVIRNAIGFE